MSAATRRRLFLLGSTGSIGTSALDVVRDFARRGQARFDVVGLAAARNGDALVTQAREFGAQAIAVADPDASLAARADLPGRVRVYQGPSAACELLRAHARRGDLVAMDADGGPALGVCLGAQSVFASPTGLDFRPTLTARRAWRIG